MAYTKSFIRAAAAVAALAAGTQAMAAEPFNGPYVGVQGGWQQDNNRITVRTPGGTATGRSRDASFTYGAQLGYDFKASEQFVLGAEAFITGDTNKTRIGNYSFDGGRAFGLTARAGVLASPNTLVYAKGGWENGRFSLGANGLKASTNRDGWTLGAGVEHALTENVSARVEYRHTKFNSFDTTGFDTVTGGDTSVRVNRNRILAGVNYRF